MQTSLALSTRCRAVGIDVDPSSVRALVLSHSIFAPQTIQIEHMGVCALPAGIMNGAQWTDLDAVAAAISKAILTDQRAPARANRLKTAHIAMSLPQSAAWQHQASVAALATSAALPMPSDSSLDVLEPIVSSEAERALGIESTELSVDWRCAGAAQTSDSLTIVATPRRYTDARLEAAARAGLRLNVIDLDHAAALRACCFAAYRQPGIPPADQPYSAVWINWEGVQVWMLRAYCVERVQSIASENLSSATLIDELHALAHTFRPAYALVAGRLDMFDAAEQTLAWISDALHCPVHSLNLSACNGIHLNTSAPRSAYSEAAFAVAFGLAVRGIFA